MISRGRQAARKTTMPTLSQCLRCVCPTEAFLRCAVWPDFNKPSASVLSFVAGEVEELRPSGIIDRLGKHTACEAFDIQILDGYQSVVVDQPTADLVVEVRALIANVRVCPLQQLNRLTSAARASLSPRNPALRPAKFSLRLTVIARIGYLCAVAQGGERRQPDIDADSTAICGKGLRPTLNRKAGIPLTRLSLHRQGLNLPFDGAMQLDFDLPDFRQVKPRLLQGESELRVGEAVIPGARTETGEAGLLFSSHAGEERLERLINPAQRLLQHLGINTIQFWTRLFDVRKLSGLRDEVDTLTVDTPSITSFLQGSIIKLLAQAENLLKQSGLLLRWIKTKLVGYSVFSHAERVLPRWVRLDPASVISICAGRLALYSADTSSPEHI